MFGLFSIDYFSLLLPLGYLTTLISAFLTFGYLYRRRQAQRAASLDPWFPPHLQRNVYLSLLEMSASKDKDQKVPDSLLRAALLRRAQEDIQRIISLRNNKPALQQLLQRGSVSDELWQRFQVAEKEMEAELREVVEEANALSAGPVPWGQYIFQSASEIVGREILEKQLEKVEEGRQEEKEGWIRRRENVREGFLKELGVDEVGPQEEAAAASPEKKEKGGSGSEDAESPVMVEGGGPAEEPRSPAKSVPASSVPSTPASGKKKKGKK